MWHHFNFRTICQDYGEDDETLSVLLIESSCVTRAGAARPCLLDPADQARASFGTLLLKPYSRTAHLAASLPLFILAIATCVRIVGPCLAFPVLGAVWAVFVIFWLIWRLAHGMSG